MKKPRYIAAESSRRRDLRRGERRRAGCQVEEIAPWGLRILQAPLPNPRPARQFQPERREPVDRHARRVVHDRPAWPPRNGRTARLGAVLPEKVSPAAPLHAGHRSAFLAVVIAIGLLIALGSM